MCSVLDAVVRTLYVNPFNPPAALCRCALPELPSRNRAEVKQLCQVTQRGQGINISSWTADRAYEVPTHPTPLFLESGQTLCLVLAVSGRTPGVTGLK